jgi:hypothetical protein
MFVNRSGKKLPVYGIIFQMLCLLFCIPVGVNNDVLADENMLLQSQQAA